MLPLRAVCFLIITVLFHYYKRVCSSVGIESSGQHALRHTFATRCIEAGIPAVVLKTWLGHKDIHMTLDTYTDVFQAMDNDAISKYLKDVIYL